jgi:hypothetical protein
MFTTVFEKRVTHASPYPDKPSPKLTSCLQIYMFIVLIIIIIIIQCVRTSAQLSLADSRAQMYDTGLSHKRFC